MPLLIAHRGASAEAPENTVPAIRRAWKRGCDGVEIDIHLTRDNRLAVIHDGDTGRVARVSLPVERSTLAQLQALDVGRWKRKRYVGRRVPSLDQALAAIPVMRWAFLELKSESRIAPYIVRALVDAGRTEAAGLATLMICSFKLDTLAAVRDEAVRRGIEGVQLGWICGITDVEALRDAAERESLFWRAESAGCSWLSLHHSKRIDGAFVAQARQQGLRIASWTVDKPQEVARLVRVGVDAVLTNDPKTVGAYVRAGEGGREPVAPQARPALTPTRAAIPAWSNEPDATDAGSEFDSATSVPASSLDIGRRQVEAEPVDDSARPV
ncbi:MAG: glycerophosphodiester phosphodiesterase family protein [Planctomycetota bacterium]